MIYMLGVVLIIYFLIRAFTSLVKRDWKFSELFIFFMIALACDILSTLYFVYILGLGWSVEANYLVNKYGNIYGHLNIIFFNHFLISVFGFLIGFMLHKISPSFSLFFYGAFIILIFAAVLNNIIFTTIKFALG